MRQRLYWLALKRASSFAIYAETRNNERGEDYSQKNMTEKILFLLTGGTIDSYYDPVQDAVIPLQKSALPDYIKSLQLGMETEYREVCMKDSREITREDRMNILQMIEESSCANIIITHGTYTLCETARYLDQHLAEKEKKIILTGAMIPYQMPNSDAAFNLGYAVAALKNVENGVYVAMNGQVFLSQEAEKDREKGVFRLQQREQF